MKKLILLIGFILITVASTYAQRIYYPRRVSAIEFKGFTSDPSFFIRNDSDNRVMYWDRTNQKFRCSDDGATWGDCFDSSYTSYISNVSLVSTDLTFTGIGSAFNSTVDLSSLVGTDDQTASEVTVSPAVNAEINVQASLEDHEARIDALAAGGSDGVITNIELSGSTLVIDGTGGAETVDVDLSSLDKGETVYTGNGSIPASTQRVVTLPATSSLYITGLNGGVISELYVSATGELANIRSGSAKVEVNGASGWNNTTVTGQSLYVENELVLYNGVNSVSYDISGLTGARTHVPPDTNGTYALEADPSGFDGNLSTSDNTLQEIAQVVDDLIITGSGDDVSTFSEKTGALVGTDKLIGLSGATDFSETISGIPLSIFNNDSNFADDQTGAEIKALYEAESNTNAFTDAEKTLLGNQSGVNTGDQNITGIATNAGDIANLQSTRAFIGSTNTFTASQNFTQNATFGETGTFGKLSLSATGLGNFYEIRTTLVDYEFYDYDGTTLLAKIPNNGILDNEDLITKAYADANYTGGGGGNVATDVIWDAKGDLAVGTGSDTASKLTIGADGQFLVADSNEATGLIWQDFPESLLSKSSTITTSRDNLLTDADGLNDCTSALDVIISIDTYANVAIPVGSVLLYRQASTGSVILQNKATSAEYGRTYYKDQTIALWHESTDNWIVLNPSQSKQYDGYALSAADSTPTNGLNIESDRVVGTKIYTDVRLSLGIADTSGIITVDVKKNGVSIFTTPVSIDIGETTSTTATSSFVFTGGASQIVFNDDDLITFDISNAVDGERLKIKMIQ